ncbi:MAG: hypothetical protein KAV00_06070, partial [Phycisphaerae bacterium]|nr:hypothetical protein [Phycisphaerae bacterium]
WRPSRSADVLLLGDSFSNVFSLDAMGWGVGAGFAEQISFALNRPLDVIIRNDAGAFATREALGRELARGADRLAGKRLVIWQFTERDLAVGDWKLLDMTLGQWRPGEFIVPKTGEEMLVTAVIADASGVPRPGSVPYKDHIRSLHLRDSRDEAGKPIPDAQAVVYIWSMRDNAWTSGARLRAGQVVKLRLRPWSDVEGELGGINRSELDDSALAFETPCWAELAKTTRKPARQAVPSRPMPTTREAKPTSQPVAPDFNKAFDADCAAKVAAAAKVDSKTASTVVKGKDGFLFFVPEVRHLSVGKFWGTEAAKVSRAAKSEWADPLPVILDFKAQLDKVGVELLLVPVPPKSVVYADKLSDKAPMGKPRRLPMRVDTHLQEFYKLLAARGVKVLDLTPHFLAARKDDAGKGPIYCKTDTHFSPRGAQIAAALIAKHIKARTWHEQVNQPTTPFLSKERKINIYGDLTRMLGGEPSIKEILPARFVRPRASKTTEPMNTDRKSRILLLGDSHCLVFHTGGELHARGAGLADQITFELMQPIDLLGVKGSGVTASRINLLRRTRVNAGYLNNKKLIIWCFTARDFTESRGWRKVPIVK